MYFTDNVQFANYTAPSANRLKISLSLKEFAPQLQIRILLTSTVSRGIARSIYYDLVY